MDRRVPISSSIISGVVFGFDSLIIICVGLALYIYFVGYSPEHIGVYAAAICFVWISTLLFFQFGELYDFEPILRPIRFVDKLGIAFVTSFLFLLAAAFSLKVSETLSRVWLGLFAITAFGGTLALRLLVSEVVMRLADRQIFTRNAVIAGSGEQCRRLLTHIKEFPPSFVSVRGVFIDGPCDAEFQGYPVLGTLADITDYTRRGRVDDVIVALPWAAEDRVLALLDKMRELPVNVYLGSDLIGFRLNFRKPPSHFGALPVLEVMGQSLSGWNVVLKTIEDYSLAIVALILLLPAMLLVAIAVKIDSHGPIIFRQKRLGFNNRVFHIYKFRTMRHIAGVEDKTVQARRNDPRVTTVGRFLRRASLDELPQLFNVLNGTMSLVGPRPHAIDHNEEYSRQIHWYFARHRVKPGITGWAQVNGLRGATDTTEKMEARVKLDNYYAEHWSLLFDLQILTRTVFAWLTGRNAY